MIALADLNAQYHHLKGEIDAAIGRVLESSRFILGPEVEAFEDAFAAYCGTRHAIGMNSGTSALHLALLAAGAQAGDEVLTVPFTFVATAAAIRYTGARPVFVDIDPVSFNMRPDAIERAITPRTRIIMPVHLYGQTADMDPILEIARRHNLVVIEDAAQAHGAEYRGRRAGSMGDIACFSFYPGKNLGAFGEGGAVVTNNDETARVIRLLRDWGQTERYEHIVAGYNYRMDGLQGAILNVKLKYLPAWTEARRANARRYADLLAGAGLTLPAEMPYARHVYHVYAVRTPQRRELREALLAQGVQTAIHYPIPLHLQPAHSDLGYREGDFPAAEQAAREVLSIPVHPELTVAQIDTVAQAILAATEPVR
jgi:dTDP-4-amino-4,6-dideoxygalactose transaminase